MNTGDQPELARHLGVSDRRVRQLEVEQIITRLDGEPALYDLDVNIRRYRLYADHDIDVICREIEQAAQRVEDLFKLLRAEDDVQKRREIVSSKGGAIGQMDAAMSLANALAPQHSRDLLKAFKTCVWAEQWVNVSNSAVGVSPKGRTSNRRRRVLDSRDGGTSTPRGGKQ